MVLLNVKDADFNYITPDNYAGGQMMAEHIVACGHTHIGCIRPEPAEPGSDFTQRYLGIYDFMLNSGRHLISAGRKGRNNFGLCHDAFNQLMGRGQRPSALLCLSDFEAMGVYEVMRQRKLRIPEDLSIIGFDEQCFSQYTSPPLTTVKYPAEAVGIKLAGFVDNLRQGKAESIREQILPILIKRGSVKKF